MNKTEKQFSNRGHYLSRFVDDYQYQDGNKRHDSSESEDEFTNRFRSDYITQNGKKNIIKVAPEKNDAPKNSWITSDKTNGSPLKDDRNSNKWQYANKQNSENFEKKSSTKRNLFKNNYYVERENNVHSTSKNILTVGKNVSSEKVFKSRQEQNVNLDNPHYMDGLTSTVDYRSLDEEQIKFMSNSSVTNNIDTTQSYQVYVESENNAHSTSKNTSTVGENVPPEKVFKYRQEQNVNLDNPYHSNSLPSVIDYHSLPEELKNCMLPPSPVTTKIDTTQSFQGCELFELYYYNADLMQDERLFEYSSVLKRKILEKMSEFKDPEKAELEFLCTITDGTQMKHNQKLITLRMIHVLGRIFEKEQPVKSKSSSNCIPVELLPSYNTPTKEVAVGFNPWTYREHDDVKHSRSITTATLNEKKSLRVSFDTDRIPPNTIRKEEVSEPENFGRNSTSNVNVSGNYQSNSNVRNHFQRVPDVEWKAFHSVQESSDNHRSTFNIKETEPVFEHNSTSSANASGDYISRSTSNGHSNFQRIHQVPESERKTSHSIQVSSDDNCIMMNTRETEPVSDCMPQYKDSVYNYYRLDNLVVMDIDKDDFPLIEYSFVLKNKVLQSMDRFTDIMKKKLEFLCELTDGTQLEENQRSITIRMRGLVYRSIIRPS